MRSIHDKSCQLTQDKGEKLECVPVTEQNSSWEGELEAFQCTLKPLRVVDSLQVC